MTSSRVHTTIPPYPQNDHHPPRSIPTVGLAVRARAWSTTGPQSQRTVSRRNDSLILVPKKHMVSFFWCLLQFCSPCSSYIFLCPCPCSSTSLPPLQSSIIFRYKFTNYHALLRSRHDPLMTHSSRLSLLLHFWIRILLFLYHYLHLCLSALHVCFEYGDQSSLKAEKHHFQSLCFPVWSLTLDNHLLGVAYASSWVKLCS
jgi:hypothetical protein